MLDRLSRILLRFLKVPREPVAPPGGRIIRIFRAAPSYFRYRLAIWAVAQVTTLFGLIAGLVFIAIVLPAETDRTAMVVLGAIEALAWIVFLVQLPVSFAILHLDFGMRWYILMDRSLRIREGVLSVREKTMTFANIQQISITRDPLQRILGIANVHVRTAGGGSGGGKGHPEVGEGMHEAFFRGVDNADEIRDAIRERVRLHGDPAPDDRAPRALVTRGQSVEGLPQDGRPVSVEQVVTAARELRDELRAWRAAAAGRGEGRS